MIVFLNPRGGGGTAARRWERVRAQLEEGPLRGGYDVVTAPEELRLRLARGNGGRAGGVVVAAGGDGTVNLVAGLLMALPEAERRAWALGAVALGSSNDFHRPRTGARGRFPPVRLDAASARLQPVGRVTCVDDRGAAHERWFLVNASVGVVAAGNHLFNVDEAAGRFLKRHWTGAAIGYAAIRALLRAGDVEGRVLLDGEPWASRFSNLHVLLSPYVSGGLRYDLEVPRDRAFSVAMCEPSGTLGRVRTMAALARGRFSGRPGTLVGTARRVQVEPSAPMPVELDGEVLLARSLRCEHVPGALSVCA